MAYIDLNLNPKTRSQVLAEPILAFSEDELGRKRLNTLEKLSEYYEDVLEAIGGPEIWLILEHHAKTNALIQEKKKKERDARLRKLGKSAA